MITKTCVFDNPATMRRECWDGGHLMCDYSAELLMGRDEIPGRFFFFGANVGAWEPGRIVGDRGAIDPLAAARAEPVTMLDVLRWTD